MKLIRFLLNSVVVMFVVLFSIFFAYIYNDNRAINSDTKFVEIAEEIKPIIIPENSQETEKVLLVEPAKVPSLTSSEEIIAQSNKYYYQQLDDYAKLIYEALENEKNALKTGNKVINLPSKLGEVLEKGNSMEAVFSVAINAFECDNPDLFYLDASKLILYYERNAFGNYKIYLKNEEEYSNYLLDDYKNEQDVNIAKSRIDEVVSNIEVELNKLSDDYNKILYIHDWITEKVTYDTTLSKINKDNIYGAFVEKEAVCGGYAKAFKYLLDRANINCIIVQGIGTAQGRENHAWNYAQLNGIWYGVDCTWDDPVIIGDLRYYIEQKYYTYFLKGENIFNNDHIPFENFYGTNLKLSYPKLSEEDY
ncbi:MAG: hypothetical protein J5507_03525 [Clostridia bacterium]|nr:hypothetical protein [Clostridia bacterium]